MPLSHAHSQTASCVIFVGSYVDLVHLSFFVGIVLFFVFLRTEFKRNEEECRWRIVSEKRVRFDSHYGR